MDRNDAAPGGYPNVRESLSARRAWIEMKNTSEALLPKMVALRKESVDRNAGDKYYKSAMYGSLSARRAWIEIQGWQSVESVPVSLSARRAWIEIASM